MKVPSPAFIDASRQFVGWWRHRGGLVLRRRERVVKRINRLDREGNVNGMSYQRAEK